MDKLNNETWADYVFRNEIFVVHYSDKEKQIIADVDISPHPSQRLGCYGFWKNIDDMIHTIGCKYNLNSTHNIHANGFAPYYTSRMSCEDKERLKYLYDLREFWRNDQSWSAIALTKYNRFNELTKIISESHNEHLKELLSLMSSYSTPTPPASAPEYQEYKKELDKKNEIREQQKNLEKEERIKLYQKYMGNKEIEKQISELEKQIQGLKCQLVKN